MSPYRPCPFQKYAPWCLFVFFVLKAAMTGFWIVRPWDVPDEVGHFSYIKDLASGKGFPVLHETRLDPEVFGDFAPAYSKPHLNWIAQHPPLYHLLMVPVYGLGSLLGSSFWGSFYLIRLVTAAIFGLGIWMLMAAFGKAGFSHAVTLGMGVMLAAIPNHTYLAAAVNHDALVFFLGSCVLYFWIRYSQGQSDKALFLLGLSLGLGGVVKYTFLVLFPPLVFMGATSLWNRRTPLKTWAMFLVPVFVPLGIWALRNWMLFEQALPVDTTGFRSDKPLEHSFLEFGATFPVFSILIQSYWGLLGWMGDTNMQVRWLQLYSIYQQVFAWPVVILFALSLFYLIKDGHAEKKSFTGGWIGLGIALSILLISGWLKREFWFYVPVFVLGTAILGWMGGARLTGPGVTADRRLEPRAALVFVFFLAVHFYKIFDYSIPSGALQGTFGRYYLPVVGFLILGFSGRGLKRFPLAGPLVLISGVVYCSVELYVWLHEAVPFFHLHG